MVLLLLTSLDFKDTAVEVLVGELRGILPQCEHTSLNTDGLELSAVHVLCGASQLLKANVSEVQTCILT